MNVVYINPNPTTDLWLSIAYIAALVLVLITLIVIIAILEKNGKI